MTRKKALITGITGQDGAYLARLLLEKGYEVYGMTRRSSTENVSRIEEILSDTDSKLQLVFGDLGDSSSINKNISKILPDEIYNLGSQSHVRVSFDIPEYTGDVTGLGTLRLLESIRNLNKPPKFYQASSSEMFGKVQEIPQTENTPFHPRSPYACSKVFSYWMTRNYREGYNLFACNGILFNHESPLRGKTFVTKKITEGLARIKNNLQEEISLGNIDAKRDWGHAKDYVEAMWLMLQQKEPDDYVIATGETHSVREFLEKALSFSGIEAESNGKTGIEEEYIRKDNNKAIVRIDPRYFRPTEVDILKGNASKASQKLGWSPKIKFEGLVKEMVEYDLRGI